MAAFRSLILVALAILSLSGVASAHKRTITLNVQGTIFCLDGKNATAILGATAMVECKTLGQPVKPFKAVSAATDRRGFYLIKFPAALNGIKLGHCKVTLNSSPLPKCNVATNINGGVKGAPLIHFHHLGGGDRLYTIKPFFYTKK